eukprot:Skav225485  [mRNA]  locus=scaffold868:11422:11724:+ [translate_table: standard]
MYRKRNCETCCMPIACVAAHNNQVIISGLEQTILRTSIKEAFGGSTEEVVLSSVKGPVVLSSSENSSVHFERRSRVKQQTAMIAPQAFPTNSNRKEPKSL